MSQLVHSRCTQQSVGRITDAVSTFSTKNERGEMPLVLIPRTRSPFSGSGWWMTIPTGCHCLLQRFGKDIGPAPPGGGLWPPWFRIAYIVTQQSCTYNAPVKECPTSDNVRVGVDVVVHFTIRDATQFVYRLGAVHFDQLLSGAVDEGIRILVRAETHQTVRTLRGSSADVLLTHLNKKFTETGVAITGCTITDVALPGSLAHSLENTTALRKAMEKTRREHEFQMGEIQRKSEDDLEELKRKNEQTIVMESGKKKRAELNHEQRMVKASELTRTAMIESETQSQVKKQELNALLERTKVDMERLRVETIAKAESEAESRRVKADIELEKALMLAEAEKNRLLGEAEATKLDAQAEASASQHLLHKRKHDLEMREKDIIMKLAQKANYNLIGEPGDRLVDAVMTGHLGSSGNGGGGTGWFGGR